MGPWACRQMMGKSVVEAEVSVAGMQMDGESALDVQIDGKSAVDTDAGVVGVQIDGKSIVDIDAGVMGVSGPAQDTGTTLEQLQHRTYPR